MQRLCILVTIKKIEFFDRRKITTVAPGKNLLFNNASESFENTCLSPQPIYETNLSQPCQLTASSPDYQNSFPRQGFPLFKLAYLSNAQSRSDAQFPLQHLVRLLP